MMRNRKLKYLALITLLVGLTTNTLAVGPGFYVGLMFGTGTNNASPQNVQLKRTRCTEAQRLLPINRNRTFCDTPTFVIAKPRNNNQWGTRLFLGYKMNPYVGFETGFTFFTTVNFNINNPDPRIEACSSPNIRVGAWDVLGRLSLPFGDWFEAYIKGGGAVTYVRTSGTFFQNSDPDGSCGRAEQSGRVRPVVAIGANASLSQNWVVDLSYTRYFVGNVVSYIDFVAIGVAYHFVDKYCGQFLCDD